jgi:hypothetical protein
MTMKRFRTAHGLLTGATTLLTVLALAGAASAASGSTDIYRNEFRASFGASASGADPAHRAAYRNGSTDTWGNNGFAQSFGAGNPGAQPTAVCATGSTDIWGNNGFRKSFGSAPPSSIGLIGMCEPQGRASR